MDQRINLSKILIKIQQFSYKKMSLKSRLQNGGHFVSALMHENKEIVLLIIMIETIFF